MDNCIKLQLSLFIIGMYWVNDETFLIIWFCIKVIDNRLDYSYNDYHNIFKALCVEEWASKAIIEECFKNISNFDCIIKASTFIHIASLRISIFHYSFLFLKQGLNFKISVNILMTINIHQSCLRKHVTFHIFYSFWFLIFYWLRISDFKCKNIVLDSHSLRWLLFLIKPDRTLLWKNVHNKELYW